MRPSTAAPGEERVAHQQVELADFLPQTDKDVNKLLERLRGFLMSLANPHLRALGECFLIDEAFVTAFCRAPGTFSRIHATLLAEK